MSNNDILNAISFRLSHLFPESNIYASEVLQGLEEGDIIIQNISLIQTAMVGTRKKMLASFDVAYFPRGKGEEAILDSSRAMDIMLEGLELITLQDGNKIRAIDMGATSVDSIAHCKLSYMYYAIKDIKKEKMERLEIISN